MLLYQLVVARQTEFTCFQFILFAHILYYVYTMFLIIYSCQCVSFKVTFNFSLILFVFDAIIALLYLSFKNKLAFGKNHCKYRFIKLNVTIK